MKRHKRQILLPSILFSILVIIYLFISNPVIAQMQFEWVRNYPNFQGHSAAIDSSGNIYSVGDSSSFLIVLKHNPNGNLLWKRKLNHRKTNSRLLSATNKNNELYVSFENIAHDYVLVKIDTSGELKWENILNYGGWDEPYSIAVDKAGYIYLTGGTFNGITKCLTVKYTPQGDTLWTRINPGHVMGGRYISLDDSGYIYVAGVYSDPGVAGFFGTLKYDNNGNLKWFNKYKYPNKISYGACVKPDNKGNCYVAGTIDNGAFISGLIKYDYKGDSLWVRIFGDSLTETGGFSNFYFDDSENIYASSIYSLKYNSNGTLLWYKYNSYSLFAFVYQSNRIYCVGRGETSMIIYERDCKTGKLVSQHIYPQFMWAKDILSYNNSIYTISSASDSLILLKFSTSPINITNNTTIISDYKLYQNYPNPFNPVTKINYELPNDGKVKLMIYDVLGREIKTFVNEVKQAGKYTVEFNGHNFASGVYFYRIESGKFTDVKRMVLVK